MGHKSGWRWHTKSRQQMHLSIAEGHGWTGILVMVVMGLIQQITDKGRCPLWNDHKSIFVVVAVVVKYWYDGCSAPCCVIIFRLDCWVCDSERFVAVGSPQPIAQGLFLCITKMISASALLSISQLEMTQNKPVISSAIMILVKVTLRNNLPFLRYVFIAY